ncbi:protoporphyrinogen oxidase 1, chloroplastic-like isoform X2 [Tripterygium wilfordii]|uniref:protoporphyrinogen oxidase 1, chloroplastic-like isoform X2 n=1 Tax=Tripterygium wilfordii TaxID=458696 RepID=UPI0018F80D28|nr:protoporphyrinogen oxidase 1, chloroplastic-like isoform X2 [Tripterygium wilfordii]
MTTINGLSLLHSMPSLVPSFPRTYPIQRPFKLRCSGGEDSAFTSTISPSMVGGESISGGTHSSTEDCVIVGGGISGLCIAQALTNKHRDVAHNVIVTEARDRVGGSITTVEKDGYLWEEGPNSFQPSDVMLSLATVAADALVKFCYPPVAVVSISYPKEAIRTECLIDCELKGFGQVHPLSQGVETLGTIYSSSLFQNRAPAGRILLLNFIGGATNPGILSKTESELVEAVDRDLRRMLINPNAKDPLALGVRVWPQAIPQFLVGHFDILDAAKFALKDCGLQGLFLGGNCASGVALGRCVEGAYEIAAEVNDFLSQYAYK